MKKVELLAPAGSMESLYAAVQNGADAVYLGGNKFSARAYASNFDNENMIAAVNYCHLYGVKIYITINTLLKQDEIKEALEYVNFLYSIGADAIILQDAGLAYAIKQNFPEFEIHASTQMTIHNGEGAIFLKKAGFKRIVLSRELSLEEVKHISQEFGVETEIFIHGALCICYSGQCLMSSMIGGRSGNRGRCAQPCRLPYTLMDKVSKREKSAYLLSPKDICTIEEVESIIKSGTASLKIEGRMKRAEYVAGVVQTYRKAIDCVYGQKGIDTKEENNKLLKLFNREGFSKAYLFGNKGSDMMAYNFPKNTGLMLGKVNGSFQVQLQEDLAAGDGIRIGEDGFIVSKIFKDGRETVEASKGDLVKLMPEKYKAGDILYKTSDTKLLKELEQSYNNTYKRKLMLPLSVAFEIDQLFKLRTVYEGKEFIQYGEKVQTAIKKSLEKEKLMENLEKSGDTSFKFHNTEFEIFENGFLPMSSVNSARRQLIEQVENYIINAGKRQPITNLTYGDSSVQNKQIPETLTLISTPQQLKAYLESGLQGALAIDVFKKQDPVKLEDISDLNIATLYLKIPNIIKEEFEHICHIIDKQLPFIKGLITANLGIISRFSNKTSIIGDYKLNIFNSSSVSFYKPYISGTALSPELNKKELGDIVKASHMPVQVKIYGREELMVSEYCPIGSSLGNKKGSSSCKESCEFGEYIIRDRKNEEFILRTDKFCRSYIYNSVSTNLIPHMEELKAIGVNSFRIDFIDESYDEALKVLYAVNNKKWSEEYVNFTRGHYKRGVE